MHANTDPFLDAADRDVEWRVGAFLKDQHYVSLRSIEIRAVRGVVTLAGQVATFHEKQVAQVRASRVPGVVRLVDLIQVAMPPAFRDQGRIRATSARRINLTVIQEHAPATVIREKERPRRNIDARDHAGEDPSS
jgi:hypothetical protein